MYKATNARAVTSAVRKTIFKPTRKNLAKLKTINANKEATKYLIK